MNMNRIRFKGLEDIVLMSCPNTVKGRMKRALMRIYYALCRYNNAKQLEFICNLHPCYEGRLTSEQSKLLEKVSEYVQADRFVTKNRRVVYALPSIERVTLWQLIETRRAETATEKVTKWCTPVEDQPAEYSPDNIYHLLSTMKYVKEQIEAADALENSCSRRARESGHRGGRTEGGEEHIGFGTGYGRGVQLLVRRSQKS